MRLEALQDPGLSARFADDESEDAAIWVIRSAKLLPTIRSTQGREYVLAAFNDRAVASCFHRKLTRTLSENSRFEIFLVVNFCLYSDFRNLPTLEVELGT